MDVYHASMTSILNRLHCTFTTFEWETALDIVRIELLSNLILLTSSLTRRLSKLAKAHNSQSANRCFWNRKLASTLVLIWNLPPFAKWPCHFDFLLCAWYVRNHIDRDLILIFVTSFQNYVWLGAVSSQGGVFQRGWGFPARVGFFRHNRGEPPYKREP